MSIHPSKFQRLAVPALALTAFAGLAIFYFIADPATSRWAPKCLFHTLTGLNCPGCGSQRFFHALLHGHFIEAIHYNALFIIAIPYLLLLALTSFFPARFPRLFRLLYAPTSISILIAIIIAWTILRNIFGI